MRLILLFFLAPSILLISPVAAQTLSANFFFNTGQARVSPADWAKLKNFIRSMDTLTVLQMDVTTYCDDRGSDAYNKNLSLKRAGFIKKEIRNERPEIKVKTNGMGELPLSNTSDADAERGRNRRAEITVSYKLKQNVPMQKASELPVATEEKKASAPQQDLVVAKAEKKDPIISDDQKVGDKITLENILFAGGRHILLPESYESLENLKNLLLEKQKYHIMILGHICCITSGEDGMDFDTGMKNLSIARAKAVYNYLVQNGVDPKRLSYKGMRANYPTGKSDREDRRVEIEITKIVGE